MIRSEWMSEAGFASGLRAEALDRSVLDATAWGSLPAWRKTVLALVGACVLSVVFAVIVAIGFGAKKIELLSDLVSAPGWIAGQGLVVDLAYSGAAATLGGIALLAVGALGLAVAVELWAALFYGLVCIGYATTTRQRS